MQPVADDVNFIDKPNGLLTSSEGETAPGLERTSN
jgi:hypothetical protein